MVVIDSIFFAWINAIGGVATIYSLLSYIFVFTTLFIFYKITT